MKKQFLIGFLVLFPLLINAQVEVLNLNGTLANPVGVAVKDNFLFIGQAGAQTLSRVDLSQPDPKSITNLNTNITLIGEMLVNGDLLYIASGDNNGSVYVMDLTDSTNRVSPIVSNLGSAAFGLAIQGNDLYIAVRLNSKIVKVDLTQANPIVTDFVTSTSSGSIDDLEIYQGYLYFTTVNDNTVSRVNLNQANPMIEEVISNIPPSVGLARYQNILLIAAPEDNLVGMINLDDANPVFENVTTLTNPWNLAIENSTLYISQQSEGRISTFNVASLSTSNSDTPSSINIYPNPTSDYIKISNLSKPVNYTLTDVTGKTILSNTLEIHDMIDVSSLSKGVYFLSLPESASSYKIIKE